MVDCKVCSSNFTPYFISLEKCKNRDFIQVFAESVAALKTELADKKFLIWDKDDKSAMDFVTACANVRAYIFSIQQNSRFQIKCKCFFAISWGNHLCIWFAAIAGNIIPAIATANAIIAGLVVLYAFRLLVEEYEKCPSVYLRQKSVHSKFVLAADKQLSKVWQAITIQLSIVHGCIDYRQIQIVTFAVRCRLSMFLSMWRK